MNDTEWQEEWSRHYDSVQWTSIYVFTTAVVLLLSYAYTTPDKTKGFWYYAIGLGFTNLTIYNTAGFRELRTLLHHDIQDKKKREFLTNDPRARGIYMWPAFLAMFLLLDVAWLNLYWQYGMWSTIVWLIISAVVFGYSAYRGHGGEVSWPRWVTWVWDRWPTCLSWRRPLRTPKGHLLN